MRRLWILDRQIKHKIEGEEGKRIGDEEEESVLQKIKANFFVNI